MIDLENIFVAEYSVSQDAFHVSTFGHSIETNRRMIVEKANNDYRCLKRERKRTRRVTK